MNQIKTILLAALGVVLVSGCQAPRGLQHEVAAPQPVVDKQQSDAMQQFAKALAEQPMGSVQTFNETPFGTVQASKDREYVNGLGERCYRITVKTESISQPAAVCRGTNNQWRYVELVH